MSDDSPRTVSRSAMAFLSGTFLSRVTGLGRDMAMAFCFGSQPAIAAFMVAFRFANLIRRLLGEGPLPSGFVPHFEAERSQSPEKGAFLFRDLFHSLTALLILIILGLEGGLYCWLHFGHPSPDSAEVLRLTMLMLPGVLFICLFGLSSALLQCERNFFLTGFAPAVFNLVWIGAVWWLKDKEASEAAAGLSLAIVLAFFLQWLVIAPKAWRFLRSSLSVAQCFKARLFSKELLSVAKPFLLAILGVGAVQINSALDGIFARFASVEGPAYLWYAIRLEQLPLALFGIALASALLPPLSRAIQSADFPQYQRLLRFALNRSFSLILPCTIAIFVLGAVSVNLLYGRGDFDGQTTYQTIICLWGYGIGLIPSVFVILLAPAFYAQKDYKTPMMAATLSVLLNVALNATMVFLLDWGAFSIAVATSLSALFNCGFLVYKLQQKTGPLFDWALIRSFLKTTLCGVVAGSMTLALGHFLTQDFSLQILLGNTPGPFPRQFSEQLLQFFVLTGTFGLLFFSYAWMLGMKHQPALEN
jgi:putative peptidoglycan lipid II flippase